MGTPVAFKPLQVLVQPDHSERPGTRAAGFKDARKTLLEDPPGQVPERWCIGAIQDCAKRPKGAPLAVLGTALFEPVTLVAHEVSEAFAPRVEGVPEEGKIARAKLRPLLLTQLLKEDAHDQRPRVV